MCDVAHGVWLAEVDTDLVDHGVAQGLLCLLFGHPLFSLLHKHDQHVCLRLPGLARALILRFGEQPPGDIP